MTKVKTNNLIGASLDWAVAKADGYDWLILWDKNKPRYSTDWAQGGPIIERELLLLRPYGLSWECSVGGDNWFKGQTPLIAAMRCYVALKLGDEVEIPEELAQ